MIHERLKRLREEMKKRNMDFYYIPTADYHNTESVSSYFKSREYMSGFTGSEGDLLVSSTSAWLWVDGRYYLQAEKELAGSSIIKMEDGEPDVLSINQLLKEYCGENSIIGMDGKVVSTAFVNEIKKELSLKDEQLATEEDLVGLIWKDRPNLSRAKANFIEDAGENSRDKLTRVQNYLKENDIDAIVFNQLDDIAWLINMRGRDVEFFPVAFAFMIVMQRGAYLFIDENKLSCEDKERVMNDSIDIHPYEDFNEFLKSMDAQVVSFDDNTLSYYAFTKLNESVKRKFVIEESPVVLWKSMKNSKEIRDTKQAHIRDGVAMVKFLRWLEEIDDKTILSEVDIANKVDNLRREQEGFIEPSFSTIAGYGKNGAIIHYHPQKEKCLSLENKSFLLLDSGGQYCDGTTDVTRTIALGELSKEEKTNYTAVLRAMIRLSKAKFLEGCRGINLDILARGILWDMNLDYKHGTGHGVGHVLNVHEGPIGIRWKKVAGLNDMEILREGMILSNEPGVYIEDEYGIRIENELLVVKDIKNEYGQFLKFEELTLIPIDKKGIILENMTKDEIEWLNDYHKRVYNSLETFLSQEEKNWLKKATSPL